MVERSLDIHGWDNDGELILTGSANAYVAATARPIAGYFQGLRICGKANHTSTGAATLNVNGLGSVPISGSLASGRYYDFLYDVTNNVFQVISATREGLSGNRTYYVRTDGSDSNAGDANTAAGAFLTVQKALDVVYGTLDLSGFDVTIQLADGTYGRGVVDAQQVGAGMITLQGNAGTPANVILTATAIGDEAGVVDVRNGAVLTVKDMALNSVTTGSLLYAKANAAIYFQNIRFGATGGSNSAQIFASSAGYIQATGDYTINGNTGRHIWANALSEVRVQSRTITLTGTPVWASEFARIDYAGIGTLNNNTFSGSATGTRFVVNDNGVVVGGGLTAFPGTVAGTVARGGIHAGLVDYVTDAQVRSAAAGRFVFTVDKLESAAADVALTDAATVAVNWDNAINFTLTVTANRIIGNPTNGQPGTWRTIYVLGNDATDRTITFDTQYLGEVPVITDADNARAYLLMIYCRTTTHFVVSAKRALG